MEKKEARRLAEVARAEEEERKKKEQEQAAIDLQELLLDNQAVSPSDRVRVSHVCVRVSHVCVRV